MHSAGPVQGDLIPWRELGGEHVNPTRNFKPMGRDLPDDGDEFLFVKFDFIGKNGEDYTEPNTGRRRPPPPEV
jgi:hypothetical protein